ncbi:MAG: Glu-tRNA(Gln) amidotransferase subunit GatD [Candidatus Odinarchaeum yellowstonii]|uniref:Glutamyl-tRNA(Gln) amidotransferase subunit D n=1 Tax=Odinarchaeota yellowstonii (strain LCB_4) TaxID=1841599 RepID=A0AAF0IAX0_ODILC|nr:MAG: Glu-tRNA(Gln) amidotransferase subunit GatD [Candidatus Odinarchaeum yellowstonii]
MELEDSLKGYRGRLRSLLKSAGARIWSLIRVIREDQIFEGVLLPRSELEDDQHINLKLKNGYNIGVKYSPNMKIDVLDYKPVSYRLPERETVFNPDKPNVTLIGTGGTVASRLDYNTGAVIPAFTPSELFSAVPEIAEICNLTPKPVMSVLSENMKPEDWIKIAKEVDKELTGGSVKGVIIAHGTDTMTYTASALAFMLRNPPAPIVFVGSQRSSDRPSSDAAFNLINACVFASTSDVGEVVVCMHGSSSDNYALIHRATRVRKMHSSRRDAFKSIGSIPLAKIENRRVQILLKNYRIAGAEKYEPQISLDTKVVLLYFHPGMDPNIIDYFVDKGYHGIVFMGTGLGHVSESLIPSIKRAVDNKIPVLMTTQTIWGYTGLNVYETGRKLLAAGVIPCSNLLPEVAYTKLMWVLSQTDDLKQIRSLIHMNLAGEILDREEYNGFIVLQGVEKGVEDILKNV